MFREIFFGTIILVTVLLFLLLVSGCFRAEIDQKEAQKILNDFYDDNVPEPILDRHLLSAGKAIVPYLLIEIQKRDMPKRGYAILALGKIGDRRALPVLIRILEDRSEIVYFRDDALRAIWHIDRKLGWEYAKKYAGENKEFDRTLELLKEGNMDK
jgi:HEAT repeat protein